MLANRLDSIDLIVLEINLNLWKCYQKEHFNFNFNEEFKITLNTVLNYSTDRKYVKFTSVKLNEFPT